MALPKVLAVAVGSMFAAGAAAALSIPTSSGTARADQAVDLASNHGATAAPRVAASSSSSPSSVARPRPSGSTFSVPASHVPISTGADPAQPLQSALSPASGPPVELPVPTSATLPSVKPLGHAVTPDAVVMLSTSLTPSQLASLPKLKGVEAAVPVDTGTVELGSAPVVTFGVDPSTFRAYTPAASASSDRLWQYLAGGSLVSSYEMASDRKLALGSTQTITGALTAPVQGWLGAFASIGLPGVDMLVARRYSPDLHLTPDSGLVVSAPSLSGTELQQELVSALPGASVELLHPDQVPATIPGDTLGSTIRQKIISAALSRQGLPYVWGATGPDSFDCSGLVQWAYRQAGILMPRVAAEQFLTGDHIPLADAEPGDLLFWTYDPNDPGYVDHVGIYLGNGEMVVAPHTGTDVQISSVPTEDFAGAVQVVLKSS